MAIRYTAERDFTADDLRSLFLSVQWLSADYPERLEKAMKRCETVFTAWDGEKLVGLVNAIDDGELTAYVHYLLVDPAWQGQGIGGTLLRLVKEKYRDYLYIVLIAECPELVGFYEANGFTHSPASQVVSILNR